MKQAAKVIRVLSVPPVMVAVLILVLTFARDDIFVRTSDTVLSLVFLSFLPVLAYPMQKIIPGLRPHGREAQRNLAILFSVVGYAAALLCSIARGSARNLIYIDVVYLLSVVVLVIFNKVLHLRASGHACSAVGPVLLLCLFLGWRAIVASVIAYGLIFWSSLFLRRHTAKEFLLGTLTAAVATVVGIVLLHPTF